MIKWFKWIFSKGERAKFYDHVILTYPPDPQWYIDHGVKRKDEIK